MKKSQADIKITLKCKEPSSQNNLKKKQMRGLTTLNTKTNCKALVRHAVLAQRQAHRPMKHNKESRTLFMNTWLMTKVALLEEWGKDYISVNDTGSIGNPLGAGEVLGLITTSYHTQNSIPDGTDGDLMKCSTKLPSLWLQTEFGQEETSARD